MSSIVSRQTGTAIPYHNLPEAKYADVLKKVGVPDVLAQAVAGYDAAVAKGALFDESRQLSALIGPTTPLSDAVGTMLKPPAAMQETR
jgi:NAD(P)H dehydrogenase (quinone)